MDLRIRNIGGKGWELTPPTTTVRNPDGTVTVREIDGKWEVTWFPELVFRPTP